MLSGCVALVTIPGKYQYQDGSTFILHNDYTFNIHFTKNNKDFNGKYTFGDGKLYLNYPMGYTESFTGNASVWIDKDGWRWERVTN